MTDGTNATGFDRPTPRGEIAVLVGAAVLLLALGTWVVFRGLPALALRLLPPTADRSLGDAAAGAILDGEPPCDNPDLDAALGLVVAPFEAAVPAEHRPIRVHVLPGDEVNAFALPGGHVFVYRGLLDEARSAPEVAGVVAHELGHVALRHGMRRIVRQAGLQLALMAVLGDAAGIVQDLGGLAAGLGALKFDRDEERAADEFAAATLRGAGLDPAALGEFLGRMADHPVPSFLTTHPDPAERLATLRELAAAGGAVPVAPAALPGIEALKAPCATRPR